MQDYQLARCEPATGYPTRAKLANLGLDWLAEQIPNIQTLFTHRMTNAGAESMNSKIPKIKVLARGFRTRDRFRMAIYFHLGGLDLYPVPGAPRS